MGAELAKLNRLAEDCRRHERERHLSLWKLPSPVLCFEFKGYNYQGDVSSSTIYYTNGVQILWEHSLKPVEGFALDDLSRRYPATNNWRVGDGRTVGFPGALARILRRLGVCETLYETCFNDQHPGESMVLLILTFVPELVHIHPVIVSAYTGGN